MKRKAQGISINIIIVAVIALVVLVVLVAIFTGRLGLFSKGLSETTTCKQLCVARGYDKGVGGSDDTAPVGYPNELLGARDNDQNQCWCANN